MRYATLLHTAAQSACIIEALGLHVTADRVCGAESSPVGVQWIPNGCEDGVVASLAPPTHIDQALPLGHQGRYDDVCCPVLADEPPSGPHRVRLSAVAVPIDSDDRVLLTRRPRSMRTFPGAWVLPGGAVDAEDATVAHAALRELNEEVGLRAPIEACEPSPLALWESCFPVSLEGWRSARASGARINHVLAAFVVVRIDDELARTPLRLEPAECDGACWVPLEEVAGVLCGDGEWADGDGAEVAHSYARARVVADAGRPTDGDAPIDAALLSGVYPNAGGEGVARGNLWALRQLRARRRALAFNK